MTGDASDDDEPNPLVLKRSGWPLATSAPRYDGYRRALMWAWPKGLRLQALHEAGGLIAWWDNSLLLPPISQIQQEKFPASPRREFRRNRQVRRDFLMRLKAKFPANCKKFPAESRISGNLDGETGSIATASTATVRIAKPF